MKTSYNLAEGAKPQSNAVDINYLFVVKQAVIPVVKENAVFMFGAFYAKKYPLTNMSEGKTVASD